MLTLKRKSFYVSDRSRHRGRLRFLATNNLRPKLQSKRDGQENGFAIVEKGESDFLGCNGRSHRPLLNCIPAAAHLGAIYACAFVSKFRAHTYAKIFLVPVAVLTPAIFSSAIAVPVPVSTTWTG